MSKFSVKKPITVLVGVVIVLVLGFVSFSKMTPDLMPNMDMPYVMVMTAYPGATPEEVEENLTKPLEQALSTLEHLDEVESTSSANYSTVTLKFTEDVNMDTVSVDILQKINMISGEWDEAISSPFILKLNPTMMPVTVAAVSMEGKKTAELSALLDSTLMNKLEGTAGVASITASGTVKEQIHVTLNKDKIKALNRKISGAVDDNFTEAEQKLSDAQSKIDSGKAEIEAGKAEVRNGQQALAEQTAQASAELNEKQQEISDGRAQIQTQLQNIDTQLQQLETSKASLEQMQKSVEQLESAQKELQDSVAQLKELQKTVDELETAQAALDAQIASAPTEEAKEAIRQSDAYKQTQAGLAQIDTQLKAMGMSRDTLADSVKTAEDSLASVDQGLSQIDAGLASQNIKRSDIPSAISEMETGMQQLEDAKTQLNETLKQLESGEIQLNDAKKELEKQKTNSMFRLSDAAAQLASGESALTSSQQQVDSSLEQLKEAKEDAHDKADLNNIITLDTLSKILAAQNFSMPAGYVEEKGVSYLVSVGDKIRSEKDMKNLTILDLNMDGVDPIKLSDVADIELTDNSDEVYANINGSDGILLSFSKQSTYATADVANNINKKFEELSKEYPGLTFTKLLDQGGYIYEIIYSIMQSLVLGAVFAVLILFLFLKSIKPTFIILCSIPISVVFAFVLMYFSGVTLNMISMSGLAVAVGMLVDNSVVVIENIYRLRHKGVSAVKSAIIGASQVAAAIASSTLTTVCVFLPIVFVEGLTRQLFTDMALTMGFALIASLIVALTLVPAMSSRMLRKEPKKHRDFVIGAFLKFYEKTLRWSLRFKPIVIGIAVLLLVGSGALALIKGFVFMPDSSATEVSMQIEMPEEALLKDTRQTANEIIRRVQARDDVETVGAMLSSSDGSMLSMMGNLGGTSVRNAILYVNLKDGVQKTTSEISGEIIDLCKDLPCTLTSSDMMSSSGMLSGLTDDGISIRVYGNELADLQKAAKDVAKKLEGIEGTMEVEDGIEEADPAIQFTVNKAKAMEHGLTVAQVYQKIAEAIQTETKATTVNYSGSQYDVMIVKGKELTPKQIKEYKITVEKQDGTEERIAVSDIAKIVDTETLSSIDRINQNRYLDVKAKIKDGYNITRVTDSAKQEIESMKLPPECRVEFSGGNEDIMASLGDLVQMLLLGVLLVYLIMVAQFQSLKHPFIIMFTIPLAFTGGLLALLITGMEISVISMIGFVMLCGIIVNNGIVLVDYINQLRLAGVPKREALVEAGKTRMRPILMTTVTTILGLIVMALGIGSGNEMMQPVAIVCIGGLLYATLLTLYIIPIIYDLMNRKDMKRIKKEDLDITAEEMLDQEFSDYIQKHGKHSVEAEAEQADIKDALPEVPPDHPDNLDKKD